MTQENPKHDCVLRSKADNVFFELQKTQLRSIVNFNIIFQTIDDNETIGT